MKNYPITHYELVEEDPVLRYSLFAAVEEVRGLLGKQDLGYVAAMHKIIEYANEHKEGDLYGLFRLGETMGMSQTTLTDKLIYHHWRLWVDGEKIYYIKRDLAEALANTRISINPHMVKSPFKSIYIAIDPIPELHLSDSTDQGFVKGIYVTLQDEEDGTHRIRFLATTVTGSTEGRDVNYHASFRLGADTRTLDEMIKENGSLYQSELEMGGEVREMLQAVDLTKVNTLFKFVVNALLYITSRNADLEGYNPPSIAAVASGKKNKSKAAKMLAKAGKVAQHGFIIVGGRYSSKISGTTNVGASITCKFLVSGHWRQQWYGSESTGDRRQEPIWIEPFIKGEEFADELNSRRIVV